MISEQQMHYSMHHMPQTNEEVRTLWVGNLQYWMEESYLRSCFLHTGEQVISARVIRNKATGISEGYGFVEFASHADAEVILLAYNGSVMPQSDQAFRLNWASCGSSIGKRHLDGGSDHSIYVGNLAPDVMDYVLLETFRSRYRLVKSAKVVIDPSTGRSRGYGFVRFGDESEKNHAMMEMTGVFCSSRPMRISAATPKRSLPVSQQYNQKEALYEPSVSYPSQAYTTDHDPNNTRIFVGGLDPNVTEEDVRQLFGQFGDLIYVKVPFGKNCAFVQYAHRACAEEALHKINGCYLGQHAIHLSWGRSPNKQQQPTNWVQSHVDPGQCAGNYYGYGQAYEGWGYTQAAQDMGGIAYPNSAEYNDNYARQGETQPVIDDIFQANADEEGLDPFAFVDIEKMNVSYIAVCKPLLLARHFWMKTEEVAQTAESG